MSGPERADSQIPAKNLLEDLGWDFVPSGELDRERAGIRSVILEPRLRAAIERLNPGIPEDALSQMIRALTTLDVSSLMEANEQVHNLITFGYTYKPPAGGQAVTYRFCQYDQDGRDDANEYTFTMEFRIDTSDATAPEEGRFDLTCFINGIPVVIVECKNPMRKDAVFKGVGDLLNYQLRVPRAFHHSQPLISMAGIAGARFGVVGTPRRHYANWKDPYPMTLSALRDLLGREPTLQDRLIAGMLAPPNLLELIRYFVVFEETGDRKSKKMARDYQYRAVKKLLRRIEQNRGSPAKSGGVVHHTQGAGKSLTMLFLATMLRATKALSNPTILIMTDRRDLDGQIAGTFRRCGFANPIRVKKSRDLNDYLPRQGLTLTTTIQKFLEFAPPDGQGILPLNRSSEVIVLVDEGHRTQYSKLRRLVKGTLPNATFVAFTGTPIDKSSRSTTDEFGGIVDRYTREDSIEDGNTLPILYERREADEGLDGADIDKLFTRYFSEYSEEDRERIRKEGVRETVVASAPRRIDTIAFDILEHYEAEVKPNGFKGLVVASSREAALRYRLAFEKLGFKDCAVIMTKTKEDTGILFDHRNDIPDQKDHERIIGRFKDASDPLAMLIVCDMLLTGFDAPVLQALYFDSNLREHNLLQALDRVNRPHEGKDFGFFVDYWGVTSHLASALSGFEQPDIEEVERTVTTKGDKLQDLANKHRAVRRHFGEKMGDIEACVALLGEDDGRADFEYDFRAFSNAFDTLSTEPTVSKYEPDLRFLSLVRARARIEYNDDELDLAHCRERVKQLIHEHLVSAGVEARTSRVEVTAERIREAARESGDLEAAATKMRHAVRRTITVRLRENPAFYKGLRERLDEIIRKRKERAMTAQQELDALLGIVDRIERQVDEAAELGLTETEFAFYESLRERLGTGAVATAKDVAGVLSSHAQSRDWKSPGSDVQRLMRRDLKVALFRAVSDQGERERLVEELVELAKVRL